jgi:hypothetical protein
VTHPDENLRRSERIKKAAPKLARYAMYSTKLHDGLERGTDQATGMEKAKLDEIKLVFKDLKAVDAVRKKDIPYGHKAHNTHLFTLENSQLWWWCIN